VYLRNGQYRITAPLITDKKLLVSELIKIIDWIILKSQLIALCRFLHVNLNEDRQILSVETIL